MKNQMRNFVPKSNQQGGQVQHNYLLSSVNVTNNLWSALNNVRTDGDKIETIISVFLVVADILSVAKDATENSKWSTAGQMAGVVSHLLEAGLVIPRLVRNLNKYWDYRNFNEVDDSDKNGAKYNDGLIPVSTILDILSDITTLTKKIVQATESFIKETGKLVTPYSVALDVIAALMSAISNEVNSKILNYKELVSKHEEYSHLSDIEKEKIKKEWEDKYTIHKDKFSFGELFSGAILKTLSSWNTLTLVLEIVLDNVVPNGLNPFETPNDIDLIGTNNNDMIDADTWFDDAYRIYGNGGNDTLIGGNHNDKIWGGDGNDILKGKNGNDTLLGGEGFDTYHIEDHDTVYDADGKGKLIFEGGWLSKDVEFSQAFEDTLNETWAYKVKGKTTHRAYKDGKDLIIMDLNNDHQVTVKDFFDVAVYQNNAYSALNIQLPSKPLNPDDEKYNIISANPDYVANIYASGSKQLKIFGSNKDDNIFANNRDLASIIKAGDGHDSVFGSNSKDEIFGGAGNDALYGSSGFLDFATANVPEEDHDIIIGNEGYDLISAGVGDDVIYVDEKRSHLIQDSSNRHGDWALGGILNRTCANHIRITKNC